MLEIVTRSSATHTFSPVWPKHTPPYPIYLKSAFLHDDQEKTPGHTALLGSRSPEFHRSRDASGEFMSRLWLAGDGVSMVVMAGFLVEL